MPRRTARGEAADFGRRVVVFVDASFAAEEGEVDAMGKALSPKPTYACGMTRTGWILALLATVACGKLLPFGDDEEEVARSPAPPADADVSEVSANAEASSSSSSSSPVDAAGAWRCAVGPGGAEDTDVACVAKREDAGCLSGSPSEVDGGACTKPSSRLYCEPCRYLSAGDVYLFGATRCDCQ